MQETEPAEPLRFEPIGVRPASACHRSSAAGAGRAVAQTRSRFGSRRSRAHSLVQAGVLDSCVPAPAGWAARGGSRRTPASPTAHRRGATSAAPARNSSTARFGCAALASAKESSSSSTMPARPWRRSGSTPRSIHMLQISTILSNDSPRSVVPIDRYHEGRDPRERLGHDAPGGVPSPVTDREQPPSGREATEDGIPLRSPSLRTRATPASGRIRHAPRCRTGSELHARRPRCRAGRSSSAKR